jgi:Papain-like cysteine protease AvrRpt2
MGLLPKFIYLVVEVDEVKAGADDCSCHDGQTPRLPDAEDLIKNPSTYSQDIGINCVNFTTPNRTLEEFTYTMVVRTTDPEIKSTTISDVERRQIQFAHFQKALSLDMEKSLSISAVTKEVSVGSSVSGVLAAMGSPPQSSPIHVPSLNFSASAISSSAAREVAKSYRLTELATMIPGRTELNASTAIDWDSTPTFYQAATIAHGHVLHYKQVWKADGYSMGDLLYSLPLAPGQKKQIVIFDWDRTEFGRRDEDNHEDSALNAYLSNNRDVTDIVNGSFSEQSSGSSSANTSGRAGGIGGAIGGTIKGIFFGAVGGFSASGGEADSTASQSSARQISSTGMQQLRQVIQQGASSVRNARQTVVQTGRQTERFKVQTEVVANHNHCHAITIEYFEVLRHYAIESRLSDVQECLFVPLLISQFDNAKVVRWRNIIQETLKLPPPRGLSSIFGPHPLVRGLDSCERINAAYEGSDFPTGMYAEEAVENISGEIWVTFQLNRPLDPEDEDPKTDPSSTIIGGLIGAAWGPVGAILGGVTGFSVAERFFSGRSVADKGKIFEERIAPEMARAVVDKLKFEAVLLDGSTKELMVDPTLVSNYQRDAKLYVTVRPNGAAPTVTRADIQSIRISTAADLAASERSKIIVTGAHFRYSTAHMDGTLCRDDNVDNDLLPPIYLKVGIPPKEVRVAVNDGDPVVIPTPLNAEEKRNPRKEDIQFSRKLLDHLNADIEYYHKMIWVNMDPDRRFMLLDGHIAPNTKGPTSSGRSVASVVENQVIGIVGNCLVMPVAPGYRLDPTYKVNPILDEQTGKPMKDKDGNLIYPATDLLDHYQPLTPVPAFRVSVPTRGVFAEAVMGACNSCERKDETRFWRWEESPNPDEPTAINPIQTTPPQRSDPGNLQAAPFSNPIITMQNAPAAPDPGATLAGALNLLGKSDVFQNITGLDQNQKNALQGMLSNQESAKHYADKAVEMAKMAAMQKGGNATVDNIKKSMDEGVVDKEIGKKLIEDVYRAQISGKTSADEARQADTASNSDLGKAIAKRVADGAPISATQDHKDGTSTTVDQKASDAKAFKYDFVVPGNITPLQQPSSNGCWATVSAIMYNWKNKTSKTTEEVIAALAPDFSQYIASGLPIDKIDAFNGKIGFKSVSSNTNFPISSYYDLLQKFGPVWIIDLESADPKSLHGRVLIGIKGDDSSPDTKLTFVDPASGSKYEEALPDFVKKTEAVVKTLELIKDAQIPLAIHFVEPFDKSSFVSASIGDGGSTSQDVVTLPEISPPNAILLPPYKTMPGPSGHPILPETCPSGGFYGDPPTRRQQTTGTKLSSAEIALRKLEIEQAIAAAKVDRPMSAINLQHWLDGTGKELIMSTAPFLKIDSNLPAFLFDDAKPAFKKGCIQRLENKSHPQGSLLPSVLRPGNKGPTRFLQYVSGTRPSSTATPLSMDLATAVGGYNIHSAIWVQATFMKSTGGIIGIGSKDEFEVEILRWCVQVYDVYDWNVSGIGQTPFPIETTKLSSLPLPRGSMTVQNLPGGISVVTIKDQYFRDLEVSGLGKSYLLRTDPFSAPKSVTDKFEISI